MILVGDVLAIDFNELLEKIQNKIRDNRVCAFKYLDMNGNWAEVGDTEDLQAAIKIVGSNSELELHAMMIGEGL